MPPRRLRIGLTGGIASGKTTAAKRFSELGIDVIDADEVARDVVAPNQAGLAEIINRFGTAILTSNGQLDRRALRDLIFSDPASRKALEGILHPLIRTETERRAAAAASPYLILAIPLLVESGDFERVDRILVVDIETEKQLERLIARDSSTPEQAQAILSAQASRSARLEAADDILENSGSISDLRLGVDRLHRRYLTLAEALLSQNKT